MTQQEQMESYNVAHFSLSPSFLPVSVKVKLQLNSNTVALRLEEVNILHKLKHFMSRRSPLGMDFMFICSNRGLKQASSGPLL